VSEFDRVSSYCNTNYTPCVTHVYNPVISHEIVKKTGIVTMINETFVSKNIELILLSLGQLNVTSPYLSYTI